MPTTKIKAAPTPARTTADESVLAALAAPELYGTAAGSPDACAMPPAARYTPASFRELYGTRKMVRVTNPTLDVARFDLHVCHASHVAGRIVDSPVRMRVVIEPGESTEIPVEYLRAIKVIRGGVVVGGLAPQLVIDGEGSLSMHPSLEG